MSEQIFDQDGVTITRYAGPERPDGGARVRYQLDARAPGYAATVSFSREQWDLLGRWFCRDCSPECEGPHLDLTWDTPETTDWRI